LPAGIFLQGPLNHNTLAPEQARDFPRWPGQPENRGLSVFKKE